MPRFYIIIVKKMMVILCALYGYIPAQAAIKNPRATESK